MRVNLLVHKIFYITVFLSLIIVVYINTKKRVKDPLLEVIKMSLNSKRMKYILQWTSPHTVPFDDMGEGQAGFIKRNCPHVNCYVTANRSYLEDIKKFDVIAFACPQLINSMYEEVELPVERSPNQKYVFASIESAENYPLLSSRFNEYFNWTWTYKLESEVRWGYIVIRDSKGNVIGPQKNMNWIKLEDMDPVGKDLVDKIKSKRKAATWFVSNCVTLSKREYIAYQLKILLQRNNQVLDIYGKCGVLSCSRDTQEHCNKLIEDTYFFYLAFENSLSEDYVTEKILVALQNNVIPVVFGGANYSRFLPDGSYLDARKLGVDRLVEKMIELIRYPSKYLEYFRWKNHYSYHRTSETAETNEYCQMCSLLNDESMMREVSIYGDLQSWWNNPDLNMNDIDF